MRSFSLKKLSSDIKSSGLILWIALVTAGRFWRWRWELWRHPERLVEGTAKHMKRTLLFIRHGQTTWNVEHRLPGHLPGVELNETGHEQAARLGEALQVLPITAVISSPLERARDTAGYIARLRDLPVQTEAALMDTNVGPWAGQKIEDLQKNDPAWKAFVRDPITAPEGVETFPQVQQRVVAAVESWLAREETGDYPAFVAHADVIKLLLAYYIGLDTARAGALIIDNASVSIVEMDEEQTPRAVAIGWSPRPGWLKPPVLKPLDPPVPDEPPAPGPAEEQPST